MTTIFLGGFVLIGLGLVLCFVSTILKKLFDAPAGVPGTEYSHPAVETTPNKKRAGGYLALIFVIGVLLIIAGMVALLIGILNTL